MNNKMKLLTLFIARLAVPPGGGMDSAFEFFTNDNHRKEIIKKAHENMQRSIEAIKCAPDNPYGDDEEIIAGILVQKIEKRKAVMRGEG